MKAQIVARAPWVPKLRPAGLLSALGAAVRPDRHVFVVWNPKTRNWGDALNRYLAEALTSRTAVFALQVLRRGHVPAYWMVGSTLSHGSVPGAEIWGPASSTRQAGCRCGPGPSTPCADR